MAQAVSPRPLTTVVRVQSHFRLCEICDGQSAIGTVSSEDLCFPLSVSFHQCYIFIYMLLLPERQTNEVREPYKKQCSFGNWGALHRKLLQFFKGLVLSEGRPAVSVSREQMASSFGSALPHVKPNTSPSTFTRNSFTEQSVGAALRRVMERVEFL
jgi:hypothetical protein